MKSENILLTVCIIFILVFVSGLTIQSCKSSSKLESNKSSKVDSLGSSSSNSVSDIDLLIHKMQVDESNFEWNIEEYIPLVDSAGHVTGTALMSKKQGRRSGSKQSSETSQLSKKDSLSSSSKSDLKRKDTAKMEQSKVVKSNSSISIFIVLLLVLLLLVTIKIRCPTLWARIIKLLGV